MKILKTNTACISLTAALTVLVVCLPTKEGAAWPSPFRRKPDAAARPEFDRAQFMVINLNRGKDSTGYYLQESLRSSRLLLQQLEKAERQLDQVDKAYAKSRGRPDDKYLNSAGARIATAKTTAGQLEQQLQEASAELKSSIHQVLLLER